MILFTKDYRKFPRAIIDLKTPNVSFLRLVEIYRKMGIKNHAFILTLLQPELQGVDPHSPDLTQEQMVAISLECRYNPWYFFREVVRIPPVAGPTPVPFEANRGNIALYWSFYNSIDFALIQPRQTGKSVSVDCLMVDLLFIMLDNTRINMITKDASLRSENVDRIKTIRDLLPGYLFVTDNKDANNQIAVTYAARGNKYLTAVAQSSESAALNVGRGTTAPITHIDEGPFIKHIGTTLPAALAAGTSARVEAQKNGLPYANIFTTTAGKKDDRDGKYMYNLIHGGTPWTEFFFDAKNREEFHRLVKKSCTGVKVIINGTFSHKQVGKTDAWLADAISNSNSTGEEADRDFFNRWSAGTQLSPLSIVLNTVIGESAMDPKHIEMFPSGYMFKWYIPECEIAEAMASGNYILGMDTSEAVGQDGIGMVLIDIRNLAVVGAATINETNLLHFSKFVAEFLINYKNVTLVIEKKSTGQSIIDVLLIMLPAAGEDPFKRIFNHVVDNQDTRKEDFKNISRGVTGSSHELYTAYKREFGFVTTGYTRDILYSNVLQNAAKNAGHLVRDRTLSSELRGLVVRNGRIDHASSGHDDMAVSWLLANWFLSNGKHLKYYGIDTSQCMSLVTENRSTLSSLELEQRDEQVQIKNEIDEVWGTLSTLTDGFKIAKLEHRLRTLIHRTLGHSGNTYNIDSLLADAKQQRTKVRLTQSQAQPLKMPAGWR